MTTWRSKFVEGGVTALADAPPEKRGRRGRHGTAPLLTVTGSPPFSLKDLAAALLLGLLAGTMAGLFAWLLRAAKGLTTTVPAWMRIPASGIGLAGMFVIARLLTGENLTTGPGYDTIRWALDPARSVWLIAAILTLRCIATPTTVAGGGVGGLFIPLVVAGALAGRIVSGTINALDTFPVHRDRGCRLPGRGLPGPARRRDVRRRSNRTTGLHRPRTSGSRRRRTHHGPYLGHRPPTPDRR